LLAPVGCYQFEVKFTQHMLNQKLGVSCFYHFLLFQELASSQDPVRLKQDLEGQVWRKFVSANLS
jgi:hypothetical protein